MEDGAGLVLGGEKGYTQLLSRGTDPFMKIVTKDGREKSVQLHTDQSESEFQLDQSKRGCHLDGRRGWSRTEFSVNRTGMPRRRTLSSIHDEHHHDRLDRARFGIGKHRPVPRRMGSKRQHHENG
jgi:hypothetical protein